MIRRLRRLAFGLSPDEATFVRRGFQPTEPRRQDHLEMVGRTFIEGYHAAVERGAPDGLSADLDRAKPLYRGFAYEGAGMALALLDLIPPFRGDRVSRFLAGEGRGHVYMIHVGVGWALARLPEAISPVASALDRMDPLLRWLAIDGFGFHEGYFHWRRQANGEPAPKRLSGYAREVFDQGLGRSLWFVDGADVERVAATIGRFDRSRHGDLWSGIGLAATYAGGCDERELQKLLDAGDPFQAHLAQGGAFAAKARIRAGNPVEHTDRACRVLCNRTAAEAAEATDRALGGLPPEDSPHAYDQWRRNIRDLLAPGLSEAA